MQQVLGSTRSAKNSRLQVLEEEEIVEEKAEMSSQTSPTLPPTTSFNSQHEQALLLLQQAKAEKIEAQQYLQAAKKAEARQESLAQVVSIVGSILSQRLIMLLQALVLPLIAVCGALLLWSHTLTNPTTQQLIAVALYGALVLAPVLVWSARAK